jgi:phosphatidylserine decarboxylase
MRIDRAGAPFIAGALVPAAVLVAARRPGWAVPFAGLAAFMAYFFRDPERDVPADPLTVLAPADGRVMVAGPAERGVSPPGEWQQVSIFLSPVDVHVNRVPYGGRLTRVEYRPGKFLAAYKAESAAENERTELEVSSGAHRVIFRQLVGVLARRIVCRVQAGDTVEAGQRFGLMKFGSRMDVFVEPGAALLVKVGDRVVGGETPLARLEPGPEAA